MRIHQDITETVGNTPLVELRKMAAGMPGRVVAKIESFNPLGCVKERIGLSMINAAERDGSLKPGGTAIEPTSGNTGIGLAMVCAARGYHLILTMPDSLSVERRKLVQALGARLELTPGSQGMQGSIKRARELLDEIPGSIMPMQFSNPANPQAHVETTGPEIWRDTDGQVDMIVAGVGTGGTIMGLARYLKPKRPTLQVIAVEPDTSPVLAGGKAGPHKIQGIGAGFVPDIVDVDLIDEIVPVDGDEAIATARKLARTEGILTGISAGAALTAALRVASRPESKGKLIVVILPDTGERYLSTELFDV